MVFLAPDAELIFFLNLILSAAIGYFIGFEREARGKSAGISTQCLVIGGSMMFSYLSYYFDPSSPARIAAQIVTGVGFLGAGIILRRDDDKIVNLTTAASLWFAAAIGMSIGLNYHIFAVMAAIYAVVVLRIPHVSFINIKSKKKVRK